MRACVRVCARAYAARLRLGWLQAWTLSARHRAALRCLLRWRERSTPSARVSLVPVRRRELTSQSAERADRPGGAAQLDALFQAFCECDDLMAKLVEDNPKGYIVQTHK